MTTEPGQIYLVDLGLAAKTRPMLVVSRRDDDAPRALAVCAPITTSSRDSAYLGLGALGLVSLAGLVAGPADNRVVFAAGVAACLLYLPLGWVLDGPVSLAGATDRIKKEGAADFVAQLRDEANSIDQDGIMQRENLPTSFQALGGLSAGVHGSTEAVSFVRIATSGGHLPTFWIIVPSGVDHALPEKAFLFRVHEGLYRQTGHY